MSPSKQKRKKNRRGRPIKVNGIWFPGQDAIESYIRQILNEYGHEEALKPDHEAFVRALLCGHRNFEAILKGGIAAIIVHHIPETPHRRFEVVRPNGDRRDFAWSKCLETPNPHRDVKRVARRLILGQILRFRAGQYRSHEGWTCSRCQDLVLYSKDVAVDHTPPQTFNRLFYEWLGLAGLQAETIELVATSRYQGHSRFAVPRIAESWQLYHQDHARLRILCATCHLGVHGYRFTEPPSQ